MALWVTVCSLSFGRSNASTLSCKCCHSARMGFKMVKKNCCFDYSYFPPECIWRNMSILPFSTALHICLILQLNHFPFPFPACCSLETHLLEEVRWSRRSNTVTRPLLISSFHLPFPQFSTSTLMMSVKGFLPNLSALMFASVLSQIII